MSELLFYLIVGHAIADYPLQSDWMAKHKNRHVKSEPPPGQKQQAVWPCVLTAHALVHGGFVAVITGIWWLGLLEAIVHWVIDFFKCEGKYGIYTDQALHIVCKIVWLVIALKLGFTPQY